VAASASGLGAAEQLKRLTIVNATTPAAVPPNLSHNVSPRLLQAANSYRGDKRYLFSVYKKKPMNDMSKVQLLPRDY
jgi:hypothetical protein